MKPTSSLHFCYAKDKKEKKKRIEKTQLNMDNLILYEIIQNMSSGRISFKAPKPQKFMFSLHLENVSLNH